MSLINETKAWFVNAAGLQFLRVVAAIDPSLLVQIFSQNVKNTVVNVAAKDTKEQHDFQDGVKQIIIKAEKVITIKYNFDETDFDANKKLIITSGGVLKLSGLVLTGKSIFFETSHDNIDVEITELY